MNMRYLLIDNNSSEVLSFTVCEIFTVKMCMLFTSVFKILAMLNINMPNESLNKEYIFDDNNISFISHNFRDIRSLNLRDIEIDLYNLIIIFIFDLFRL